MNEVKQSQKDWVKAELVKHGYISRNKCLKAYVSRLSSYINQLRNEGFKFITKSINNESISGSDTDFVYYWVNREIQDLKTEYFFTYYDSAGEKEVQKIDAKSFNEACKVFLMQPPIFMIELSNEVNTKAGCIFLINEKPEFKNFKII